MTAKLIPSARSHSPLNPLLLCSLALCLGLSACSSVKTHVNKGTVSARTFSFLDPGTRPSPEYAENRKEAHAMVQHAIIQNLASKGVNNVPTGGDVTIAYLVVVGNNVATTSLNSYFGYSSDSEAIVQKVHSEQTDSNNRNYFESGTLVIDFLDPHTSKLIQRRSIQAQVL